MTDEKKETGIAVRELPEPVSRRGITEPQWLTLANNLYPGANPKSVLMVWDYCAARKLDPMKKPVHIVQMDVRLSDGSYEKRDVVLPGIYEYRITAHRTGDYLGHDEPTYGPDITFAGVKAPEWCKFTVYRWNAKAHLKVPYRVEVTFSEVVATKRDGNANQRWGRAPKQMLTKCAEAAALREAFPEEIGGEPTVDEMDGHVTIEAEAIKAPVPDAWERIPEAFRDKVEKAFAYLKLTEGQRLMLLNQYLTPTADPEEAVIRMLAKCRADAKTGEDGQPRRKSDNGVKKPMESKPTNISGGEVPRPVEVITAVDAEVVETSTPTASEIPWGNQGQKPAEELF